MGQAATNLVVIKGTEEDLLTFKKTAYKNDSEAFCFQQLLPYPSSFTGSEEEIQKQEDAFAYRYYGNRWGAGYGVLMREEDGLLMYMFNSKTNIADLGYVAEKYANLEFIHIGMEPYPSICFDDECSLLWSYNNYSCEENGYSVEVFDNVFDFNINSGLYSYEYIAELYVKFESLIRRYDNNVPEGGCQEDEGCNVINFYDLFHKPTYLRENRKSFADILYDVESIKNKDLKWAKVEIGYPFYTNTPLGQLAFVKDNFNCDVQNHYLEYVENHLDFDNVENDELLIAAKYIFDNFDYYDIFIRFVKIVLTREIDSLDNIINAHQEKKKLLKDFPAVIPHYFIGGKLLDKYIDLYDWNILEAEIHEYNDKKEKIISFSFDYLLELVANAKIEDIDSYKERKVKAKELINEILTYSNLYTQSYQKLKERISDKENPLILGFNVRKAPKVDDSYLQEIASKYEVLGDFPELMEKDDGLPDDLPF